MDAETVNKLLEINRKFYSQFSADFSDSRSGERFNIEPFQKYLTNGIQLLDVGCGNGRLAAALERAGCSLDYMGIDGSPELVGLAQKKQGELKQVHTQFRIVDLTTPQWSNSLRDAAPFDLILALAVLHHIPGFEMRANVLRQIRALLKSDSPFVMSNWQFTNSERLYKKIVPWQKIDTGDWRVETGDYMLDWKRGGTGYRYVHLVNKAEVRELAKVSGFQVIDQFPADNNLNLFSILE